MISEDFSYYWDAEEAACALLGERRGSKEHRALESRIRADMVAGKLSSVTRERVDLSVIFGRHVKYIDVARPLDVIRWAIQKGDIQICKKCLEYYDYATGKPSRKTKQSVYEQREAAALAWFQQNGHRVNDAGIEDIHIELERNHPDLFAVSPHTFLQFWKRFRKAHPEYRLQRGARR